MTLHGLNVDGFDIDEKAVQRALDHGVIQKKAVSFEDYDYYIICISTHRSENMYEPFFEGLYDTAYRISHEGKTGSLVAIESTITKGTTYKIMQILKHRLHVAHFPHRFYAQEKEEHGVRQIRVLGACEACCLDRAVHFYEDLLGIPIHVVKSVEVAELSKVIENSYRFLEIAFAEELKMFCDSFNIDFEELRAGINSKWNIKIHEAREGIGGHCLPKDAQMYLEMAKKVLKPSIIDSAKKIDYLYKLSVQRKREPIPSITLKLLRNGKHQHK
ncbi:MAG: potassium transporter TrkA [Candidatus Bathyarchaeia archaeon]